MVSSKFAKRAAVSLEQFTRGDETLSKESFSRFFEENEPRPGEFVIQFWTEDSSDDVILASTSQRMWLFDLDQDCLTAFELSTLRSVDLKVKWTHVLVLIECADGETKSVRAKMAPDKKAVNYAIENCGERPWAIRLDAKSKESIVDDLVESVSDPAPIQMPLSCLKCSGPVDADGDIRSWAIVEVVDFKETSKGFLGFPFGETHYVRGWKLRKRGEVASGVCANCAGPILQRAATRIRFFDKVILFTSIPAAALIVTWFGTSFTMGLREFNDKLADPALISFFWMVGALIIRVVMAQIANLDDIHDKWQVKGLSAAITKFQLKERSNIFEKTPPKEPGVGYVIGLEVWERELPGYEKTQERYGWSRLVYEREYGYGTVSEVPLEEGQELLGVEDLGQYLDKESGSERDVHVVRNSAKKSDRVVEQTELSRTLDLKMKEYDISAMDGKFEYMGLLYSTPEDAITAAKRDRGDT